MSFLNRFIGKRQTVESATKARAAVSAVEKENIVKETSVKKNVSELEQPIIEAAIPAKKANRAYAVLLHPLVTEKTTLLQSENKYGFIVHSKTNKSEVRRAVEAQYNVHVLNVNIINRVGKKVRFGRVSGTRRHVKKAFVTIKPGEHIEIHQHV